MIFISSCETWKPRNERKAKNSVSENNIFSGLYGEQGKFALYICEIVINTRERECLNDLCDNSHLIDERNYGNSPWNIASYEHHAN